MVLLLRSTVFIRGPTVYIVDVVQIFVRDSDMESWQFITGIQIHPEVTFGVALYRLIQEKFFMYTAVYSLEKRQHGIVH